MSNNTTEDNKSFGCPSCGETFDSDRGMKIHHKRIHGESIAGVSVQCDWCGVEFKRCNSHINENMNNFCSESCRGKYRSKHHTGKDSTRWSGGKETVECSQCGSELKRYPSTIKTNPHNFCNAECRANWISDNLSGESNPNSKEKITITCANCGEDFKMPPSKKATRRFCDRSCYHEWQKGRFTGQDHPNWTGGETLIESVKKQLTPSFHSIKGDIRGNGCEMCGKTSGKLDLHHIIPVMSGGSNHEDNFMTLCATCHQDVEWFTKSIPEIEPVLVE